MSNNTMTIPNQRLSNVTILRNILIVLLVFYHAFAIYSGAWVPISGYPEVPIYWWLDKLSNAFFLELFVFVSGYVFGYQVRVKGESKLQPKMLIWGKFKRLMIPCMVFSLLYLLLLGNIKQPLYKTAYDMLNGIGHMWFLPMLFWCFVGVWFLEKLHIKPKWAIPLLVLISLGSFLPLPLQMTASMYYMLFFYVAYIIQKNDISLDRLYNKRIAIITTLSFIVLFPLITLLKEWIGVAQMGGGSNCYKGCSNFNSNISADGVFLDWYRYGFIISRWLSKETKHANLDGKYGGLEFWCIYIATVYFKMGL